MRSALRSDLVHLRRPGVRESLIVRDRIRSAIRTSLVELGFLEVDTPILGDRIDEYSVGHVRAETTDGAQYWLAQSPQLYKQALISAGIDRYYQFAHCFRDEIHRSGRTDLLREFVQVDVEMRANRLEDVMSVMEHVVRAAFAAVNRPLPDAPIQQLTYAEAVAGWGTEKPDLRDENDEWACVWVVSFPMAYLGPGGQVILNRHPMAAPTAPVDCSHDLLRIQSHSFDLVVNGVEVASGDLRIHDSELQCRVLRASGIDPADFGDLLAILDECPPHGGFGMGLDRLTMQLLGAGNVSDATGFPAGFGA